MLAKQDINSMLKRMEIYIEQDGYEKAEEIDVIAEEEFYREKMRYMEPRLAMVKSHYANLEKKLQQQSVLNISKMKNHGYQDILTARSKIVDDILDLTKFRLIQLTDGKNELLYKKVIFQLIVQGIFKIMEPSINIKVRKKDLGIVKSVLTQGKDFFKVKTGMVIVLKVDEEDFLPDKQNGGVWLLSEDGRIAVDNTLDSKIRLVQTGLTPHIRKALFGPNPNRKHLI